MSRKYSEISQIFKTWEKDDVYQHQSLMDIQSINWQCFPHIETSQLICANQLVSI